MKQKIKSLITYFSGRLNLEEKKIPVQDISVYFAVLIATFTLRTKQSKEGINSKITFHGYHTEFEVEIELIKQRFPELIITFSEVESKLTNELLSIVFEKLQVVFEKTDNDVDDIISWSYQFLKKDLVV